jgi:hypothetical protein
MMCLRGGGRAGFCSDLSQDRRDESVGGVVLDTEISLPAPR